MPYNALMHEEEIADWFAKAMSKKYRAGQDEHGGKLWRKPMLKNMQDEVVDLVVYFHTHNMQQLKLTSILYQLRAGLVSVPKGYDAWDMVEDALALAEEALNLIEHGNEDGDEEEERNP